MIVTPVYDLCPVLNMAGPVTFVQYVFIQLFPVMIKNRKPNSKSPVIMERDTIHEVQKKFNDRFHYLKIEFFREPTIKGKGTNRKKMYLNDVALKDLHRLKKSGQIKLENKLTVSELETLFFSEFGLYTQVFRKSGNIWLETSATNHWTLEQQNEEGKSLQEEIKNERENPDDHDIY